jgi:S-DNA-T family DNA segregation ATPase FtsK/SpoIIIE
VTVTGRAAWAVPLVLMVWGARLALHRAEERARALLAPIFVAILAVALAAWEPPAPWAHAFGLGGMFGDTGLGLLLTVLPFGDGVLAVLAGAGALALGAWVLGVTGPELREARRLGTLGLVLGYDCALRWGAAGAVLLREALEAGRARGVQAWEARRERLAEAREALLAEERALRAVPDRPEGGTAPAMGRPRAAIVRAEAPVRAMPPAVVPALGATLDDVADRRADPAPEDDGPWTFEGDWEDAEDEPAHLPFGATPADMPPADLASDDSTFADPLPPALVAPLRADHVPAPPARGFLHALLRRARGEPDEAPAASGEPATDGDRIRARIGDAIRARTAGPELRAMPPSALGAVLAGGPTLLPVPVPTLPVVAAPSVAEAPAPVARLAAPPRPAPAAQPAPRPAAPRPVAPRPAPTAPHYETPPLDLLADPAAVRRHHLPDEALATNARLLESVLDDYGVKGEIAAVRPGPVVTMYELEPAPGLKASRVIGLSDDIARSMEALSARVSTVPGRNVIGIELPTRSRERSCLREIIAAPAFDDPGMRLPLASARTSAASRSIANLAKMPHLLIAGTTGSGKSVAINTMILSLLYSSRPRNAGSS